MKGITKEIEFEERIRHILNSDILSQHTNLMVLEIQKTIDIVICRNGEDPKLFYLEIKYFDPKHGRLGFGHANGKGFQPEVLRKKPDYFRDHMRWILGSVESEDYFMTDNDTILQYVSGGEIGYKHNNIQTKIFSELPGLKMGELKSELTEWLMK